MMLSQLFNIRSALICLFLFSILVQSGVSGASNIVINEIVASNVNSLADEDGDSADWLELFNAGEKSVNLSGFALSDNPQKPAMWFFPDVEIQPDSFLLVFASKKDRTDPNHLHTNFKISANGETLLLSAPDGSLVDSVDSPALSADQAYGRQPDGKANWMLLNRPTPGTTNDTTPREKTLAPPLLSLPPGFYDQPITLDLSALGDSVAIFFSLDGTYPDTNAHRFISSIPIDTTTVLRAIAVAADGRISRATTATYLIGETTRMPVISLSTDPKNLWDPDYGIYVKGDNARDDYPYKGANFWREWERPVHIEFFENDGLPAFAVDAGMRIFGHSSVGAPFKPLAFYARKKYGVGAFKYQLFPDKDIHEFEAFMLRNSGNDWNRTLFRDAFMHQLAAEIGLPGQAYRPVIVFINGVYWGVQNLRERMNEHYVAENFFVDEDTIDLLAWNYGRQVYAGDARAYDDLLAFVQQHDLTLDENYDYASSMIHLDNFIDYFIVEIFCNNRDWPLNNQYMWKPRQEKGRWMWLLKDMDHGFGYGVSYDYNSLVRNALKDDLFTNFLKNETFRSAFINRFAFLLNTLFQPDHLNVLIDQFITRLEAEMPRHLQRWAGVETFGNPPTTMAEWRAYCDELHDFAEHRLSVVQTQLRKYFKLGDLVQISINVQSPQMGALRIQGQPLPSVPWQGEFFSGMPISLKAKARTGYRFAGWEGVDLASDSVQFTPDSDVDITAKFKVINSSGKSVVINEINYHSSDTFNPGDWVELVNPNDVPMDLNGWVLRDNNENHLFHLPQGTVLPPFSFLVICRDARKFSQCFPHVEHVVGDLDFGFSSKGDFVRLYDEYGSVVDAVDYGVSSPWPEGANGRGATLALSHPFADNAFEVQWFASYPHGSPGRENIQIGPVKVTDMSVNSASSGYAEIVWRANDKLLGNIFRVQKDGEDGWRTIGDYHAIQWSDAGQFRFIDKEAESGACYRLEYLNAKGALAHSSVAATNVDWSSEITEPFENFPNPFNNATVIRFSLPAALHVDVKIYNLRGRLVAHPACGLFSAGKHDLIWKPQDQPSGVYFCRIETASTSTVLKLLLQK